MSLEKLAQTVAKYAPLLGAVLPIPGGELLGQVVKHVFCGDSDTIEDVISKIQCDPDAAIKLRNIEMQERVLLDQLLVKKVKLANEDRANARNREIVIRDKTPSYIAIAFVGGYMFMLVTVVFLLKFFTLNNFEEKILEVMLASLSSGVTFILSYYFGASNKL